MAISRHEGGLADVNQALVNYLETRRTIPAAQLADPAPDEAALARILAIATRVPDHGKLSPWRLIVYDRPSRLAAARWLSELAEPNVDAARMANKARNFAVAPLVVGVVSTAAEHEKIPVWEQQLSAAAVCINLLHAAHAFGFSAQWLTDWYAYDRQAGEYLGLRPGERFAGFIHIGTPKLPPSERDRPDVENLTTRWKPRKDF